MPPLDASDRTTLENLIARARDISETAAQTALRALAVHEREPRGHMNDADRALRRTLRAKARQLGDPLERNPEDPMPALERELAYERWHQMLFAAFLAHNDLLIHPTEKVAVTLDDCKELATHEGDPHAWHTAARYASHMLPDIFKPQDPLLQVRFTPEDHQDLERVLDDIPLSTFTSDDGLGWIYQFWQAKRKRAVNASGVKIGGADISPVTQLFTEHYMVQFLLHNSLGAWWCSRHPDIELPTSLSYLRTVDDGAPAAGGLQGWPGEAKGITVMDPCCGSGHFLVAAFTLLQRLRVIEEGLSEAEAGDAVIRDNLFGLELDPRCTQLAAFNVSLHAWKNGGYRQLPPLNIACSGLPAGGSETDWTALGSDDREKTGLKALYHLFRDAPNLGSLIDPTRLGADDPLFTAPYDEIEVLANRAIEKSGPGNPSAGVLGEAARGLTHAAKLLSRTYNLVITNVPYLGRGKQSSDLRDHLERQYPSAKSDLATAFVSRCESFCAPGGTVALVAPQNWWFQSSYTAFRKRILTSTAMHVVSQLGEEAWTTFGDRGPKAILMIASISKPTESHKIRVLNASKIPDIHGKDVELRTGMMFETSQQALLANPGHRMSMMTELSGQLLSSYAASVQGIKTGDDNRHKLFFWELQQIAYPWRRAETSGEKASIGTGTSTIIRWQEDGSHFGRLQGQAAHDRRGIAVSAVRTLNAFLYEGNPFTSEIAVLVPHRDEYLLPLLAFCQSSEYPALVRSIDDGVAITNGSLELVPVDMDRWKKIASERFASGVPSLTSSEPSQWRFHGHPVGSTQPLHVAVWRLLGYRWPLESDPSTSVPESSRKWIERLTGLIGLADSDGIVCLPAVAGEKPAADRVRDLLRNAYGDQWSPTTEAALLAMVGNDGKTVHDWLWNEFFVQHAKLCHNRPFIWHVTDGRKDGFSALVNYHKLDRARLERLIYTYLGSYIQQVQDEARANKAGADTRLAAAQELKKKLELILEGEKPYDIFVRWKPLHEQPIGWQPDLNDGVRLNIRPFVTAGVLRSKFTINWKKDRGKDPTPNATGTTERDNDRHLTLAEKRAARRAAEFS